MKQIKSEQQIIGKTITDIKCINIDEKLVLFFNTDEYVVFTASTSYGDTYISFDDNDLIDSELFDIGLIDRVEYDRRVKGRSESYRLAELKRELVYYERLKKKFESPDLPDCH